MDFQKNRNVGFKIVVLRHVCVCVNTSKQFLFLGLSLFLKFMAITIRGNSNHFWYTIWVRYALKPAYRILLLSACKKNFHLISKLRSKTPSWAFL